MGLVKAMADGVAREIGSKTREFYEFVLPPVDMRLDGDMLFVIIDIPGFDKKDIKLSLEGSILSVQAHKQAPEEDSMICNQRPNIIDKKLRLPVDPDEDNGGVNSAKYKDGVLTIEIPVQKNGTDITIE